MTLPKHQYFEDPAITRLMGMMVALAGEVFVLKAKNERLQRALKKKKVVGDGALKALDQDKDLQAWLVEEREEFAKYLLAPILEPDVAQMRREQLFGSKADDRLPL